MEYMYLSHANYLPVDGGRIVYSAKVSPQTVRVRRSIPSHVSPGPDYLDFLNRLGERPEEHHILDASLSFDPELVFGIDYDADAEGWAHTLQLHPNGVADYVRHRPQQFTGWRALDQSHAGPGCIGIGLACYRRGRRAKRPKKPKAT